jgi:hypothetical protein
MGVDVTSSALASFRSASSLTCWVSASEAVVVACVVRGSTVVKASFRDWDRPGSAAAVATVLRTARAQPRHINH